MGCIVDITPLPIFVPTPVTTATLTIHAIVNPQADAALGLIVNDIATDFTFESSVTLNENDTFSVAADSVDGYTAEMSGDCSSDDVIANTSYECTVTYTENVIPVPSTLTVQFAPTGVTGTATVSLYSDGYESSIYTDPVTLTDGQQFSVSANDPTQTYIFTASDDCSGTAAGSTEYVCTFTGTYIIAPDTLSNGTVGSAYTETLALNSETRFPGTLSWTIREGGSLPSGLSLDSTTGVLSGTPTAAGTYSFTVAAQGVFMMPGGDFIAFPGFPMTFPIGAHAYTLTINDVVRSRGGGGGSGSRPRVVVPPAVPNTAIAPASTGKVLGSEIFHFLKDLRFGTNDSDVAELQKFLVAHGFPIPSSITTFFGSQTLTAVKAYQTAHGIPATGFVGPLTRAALNI
ncbi:MAG TPA: peptidoglycan-binding protein [Candidatus Paceibacterota bacterium]|nr:peptidoglycan-binding protein [Candidatus Paceibacterota bacterium]